MPVDPDFLRLLVCPRTRKPLRVADGATLSELNRRIAAGGVEDAAGEPVTDALEEGLQPEGEEVVYPVRDGIPVLLVEAAVPLVAAAGGGQRDGSDQGAQ